MLASLFTLLLATCVATGSQDSGVQVAPAAQPDNELQNFPQEPPAADALLAQVVRAARESSSDEATLADRIAALGASAVPALLDAYVYGRVAPDPLRPDQDVDLGPVERSALAAALARMDQSVLLDLAQAALATPLTSSRTRALIGFELAGRAQDLELALAVASTASAEDQSSARTRLEVAVAAVAARDGRAALRLRELLPGAADWIAPGLVRGLASAGSAEAVLALSEELDRSPQHELLLLGELARAARGAPMPCDARTSSEVVDRLRSADPAVARAAACAAGALEDAEALPILIALLDGHVPGVGESALAALRQITRCTYGAASGAWVAWLDRERNWLEQRAADLERQLAGPDAGKALVALREISGHKYRRHELAALAARALAHASPEVRRAACAALAELGSRAGVPHLTEHLADEDAQVARAALDCLAVVAGPGAVPTPR